MADTYNETYQLENKRKFTNSLCYKQTWSSEINRKIPLLNTHIGKAPKSSDNC